MRARSEAKRLRTRRLRLLQSLPGVGADRARNLLEHFGGVRPCLLATIDQLTGVPGIGQKTAKAIQEIVGSPRPGLTEDRE
jgi:ERCC4-type nuclease